MLFFWQLEKAREATDEANIRAVYAEVMSVALTDPKAKDDDMGVDYTAGTGGAAGTYSKNVDVKQATPKWNGQDEVEIGGIGVKADDLTGWTITATADGKVIIEEQ